MGPTIWDKHAKDIAASMNVAFRLQAEHLKEGGNLVLTIPGSNDTVKLPVVSVGYYNPRTDPHNRSRNAPSGVGVALDLSPLHGGDKGYFATIMIDEKDTFKAPSASVLVKEFNVGSGIAQKYETKFSNQDIPTINISFTSGTVIPPFVHPATADQLSSVGLKASAEAIKPNAVAAPASVNNFSAPQVVAP